MSLSPQHGYYFSSQLQWKTCLFSQADVSSSAGAVVARPFAPFRSSPTVSFPSSGAHAPACSPVRELFWRDDLGQLYRVLEGDDQPESFAGPAAIASATRLVATSADLWVADPASGSLQCLEAATLTRRFSVPIPGARVIDIAADVHDGIVALVQRTGALECVRVTCAGTIQTVTTLGGLQDASAFTFLIAVGRFVVLTPDAARLFWFPETGGASLWRTNLPMRAPCFVADAIASDAQGRVFVAGIDNMDAKSRLHILVFDGDGLQIDDVNLYERATGLAAAPDALLVSAQSGLYRLPQVDIVPDDVQEVRAIVLTPPLEAPDVPDGRRWLRVEVTGDLPQGASMQIDCASSDDPAMRDRLQAIAQDTTLSMGQRIQQLGAEDIWVASVIFHGNPAAQASGVPFAAPLYGVRERFVWVRVTLVAGAGATLPSLSSLAVLYPGRTLMENLPSIYQRAEAEPGSFVRGLVGVLETTTHTLDTSIAALGSRVHPRSAPAQWLDFLARWLGLPWDDSLDPAQKRCIATNAATIAKARGTRAGLETLLGCLIPGAPPRYRITDFSVDFGFALVGGPACRGSALPALLTGLPRSAAYLDVQARLGSMRLPCGTTGEDTTSRLVGRVRIDVAASAEERDRWSPWLEGVLAEMVPLTAHLSLRWVGIDALRSHRLADSLTLDAPPLPHLGTDAVVGRARLPERGSALPGSATGIGPMLH